MNNTIDAIENSSVILFSCDSKGIILLHEGGGLAFHNIKANEYIGKNAFDVFTDIPDYLKALEIALKGNSCQAVYKWGAGYCETHLTPQKNGGVVSICTIQTERILRERDDILQERVFAKEEAKKDFLAIISHELRTPLSGLIGIITLMKESSINSIETIQDAFVKTLDKTANKLMNLLNDLLDYSKIAKNKILIKNINYNVQELISDAVNLFNANAKENNISILQIPDLEVESYNYLGDSTRISQILNNFLSNAVKFSNTNGTIIIKNYINKNKLIFEIQDNGIGIKDSEKDLLFKDYSQLSNNLTKKSVGTGLGLFISKKLANAMDGEVYYKPNLPFGSIFILEIPFIQATATTTKIQNEIFSNNIPISFDWKNTKILVAEDSPAMQLVTQKYLHKLGYSNVEICSNGKTAWEKLQKENYDYVFLDNLMHGMTGIEIAKKLQIMEFKPIIVWMSSSELTNKELFNKNLQKPFTLNDLKNIFVQ